MQLAIIASCTIIKGANLALANSLEGCSNLPREAIGSNCFSRGVHTPALIPHFGIGSVRFRLDFYFAEFQKVSQPIFFSMFNTKTLATDA